MGYGPALVQLEAGVVYKAVIPQKIPIGGSVRGTKKPGLFKVYVPTRDGPTLALETSSGTIDVYAPDGTPAKDSKGEFVKSAAKVKFDVPDGVFGWFGVVVRDSSSYDVSAKLTITGNARDRDGSMLVPWNFFYFPFTKVHSDGAQHPSAKWQAKFGDKANDWEKSSYWHSEIEGRGSGQDGHGITKEYVDAYNKWAGSNVVDFDNTWWWGHCDAASCASSLFKQPKATGDFAESDMEYFATEIAMRGYDIENIFFLANGNRADAAHKEKPEDRAGQSLDRDVGAFHEAVITCVKKNGFVALVDMRAEWEDGKDHSPDVWNQATFKFTMEAKQAKQDASAGDEEPNARVLEFQTVLFANADSANSAGNPESPAGSGWNRECTYVLNYDASGKVQLDHPQNNFKKCTWAKTGKDYYAPRYIFQIKGLNSGRQGPGNPHISLDKARSVGLALRDIFAG